MGRLASGERHSEPIDVKSTRVEIEAKLMKDLIGIISALTEDQMRILSSTIEARGDKAAADALRAEWLKLKGRPAGV